MIHLVYPVDGGRTAAPWSIGNHIAAHAPCRVYPWDVDGDIVPGPGDVLIGHPHPDGGIFRTAAKHAAWQTIVGISPFNAAESNVRNIASVIDDCTVYLGICGPHWAARGRDIFGHKFRALDLAVDRDVYYPRKNYTEARTGRLLYIGCAVPEKGTDYLADMARHLDDLSIVHAGYGGQCIPCVESVGYVAVHDMRLDRYDFGLFCGRSDANPAALLELASMGLIPLCTPESGWGDDVAIHIPLDDTRQAGTIVHRWMAAGNDALQKKQASIMDAVQDYSWTNFIDTVFGAINAQWR